MLFGGEEKAAVFAWMDSVRAAISNGARAPRFLHEHKHPPFVPPSPGQLLKHCKPPKMLLRELEAFACGGKGGVDLQALPQEQMQVEEEVKAKAAFKGREPRILKERMDTVRDTRRFLTLKELLFNAKLAVDRGGSRGNFLVRSVDEKSALIIQATWRRYRALLEVWAEGGKYDQARAAERIQSLFRGRVTRYELEHEQNCALAIQRAFRGHMGRKRAGGMRALVATNVRELYEDFYARVYIETCATHIARSWRRYRHRKVAAATRVQALVRCFFVRRTVSKWIAAASVIQRLIRGVLGRQIFLKRVSRVHAAIKIQAVYRMRAARKAYEHLRSFVVLYVFVVIAIKPFMF